MSAPTLVTVSSGRWTPVPGTRCEVRWDGKGEITFWRHDGHWYLPAAASGCLLARITRAGRPATPPWPVAAPALPGHVDDDAEVSP